jgi:hypothetical protein
MEIALADSDSNLQQLMKEKQSLLSQNFKDLMSSSIKIKKANVTTSLTEFISKNPFPQTSNLETQPFMQSIDIEQRFLKLQ